MADAALFIGFEKASRGREARALQVFQDSLAYYARLQSSGAIESFEPVLLAPHGGDLGGFILLRGDRAKLDEVRSSEEFQGLITRGVLSVDGLGVIDANIGGGVGTFLAQWSALIAGL